MRFELTRPCDDCPFLREGGVKLLGQRRAEEIRDSVIDEETVFTCHKSMDDPWNKTVSDQACAGAAILTEKTIGCRAHRNFRIAEALGLGFDPGALELDAPVFDSWEEFVEAQMRGEKG